MKIIDLLNKIANGEEVPRIIKYDLQTYYFRNYDYKEYDIEKDFIDEQTSFIEDKFDFYKINDKVEILEEEKKIPEKLNYKYRNMYGHISQHKQSEIDIINTLNEVIDYLDYLKSKGE